MKGSCRDCVFKILDDTDTQIGCKFFNRLSKFQERDQAVLSGKHYDLARRCTASCSLAEGQKVPEDLSSQIRKAIIPENALIVMCDHVDNLENLIKQGIDEQDLPFSQVEFYVCDPDKNEEFLQYFSHCVTPQSCSWNLTMPINTVDVETAIRRCVFKNHNANYFTIINSSHLINLSLNAYLDHLVNDELEPVIAILPQTPWHELVFSYQLYLTFMQTDVDSFANFLENIKNEPAVLTWQHQTSQC